jgi:hypothetical protein
MKAGMSKICEGLVLAEEAGEHSVDAREMGSILSAMDDL